MKFIVSSAVLLSAIPGAFSAEPEPHLRGPVVVALSDDNYNNGNYQGKKQANSIWNDSYGSNGCSKISSYNKDIKNYIYQYFNPNTYSYGTDDYFFNKGAADGMKSVMKQHDSQCGNGGGGYDNNDYVDIDHCSSIGQNMASQIAEEWAEGNYNCNPPSGNRMSSIPTNGKYGNTQDCITIATDDCMGTMDQQFKTYCEKEYDMNDYSDLKKLKGKCEYKVSKIIKNAN